MKKKLVLRPYVLPLFYILLVIFLMNLSTGVLYKEIPQEDNLEYVNEEIFENTLPVMKEEEEVVSNPYNGDNVQVIVGYYNYQGNEIEQEGAIINYESTYLQNSGLTYSSNSKFDVIAIMDGEVTKVYNNEVLGNIVEITHDNDIVSIYQVLDNVIVKVHDKVNKGDKIAESGTSKIYNTNYNLHFEVLKNGNIQNPNAILGKNTKEI